MKTPVPPEICDKYYPHALEVATVVAREHGYAIGVHGSLRRDLDLIAVPWVENCSEPKILALAIANQLEWYCHPNVCNKPHGRQAWLIYGHHHAHIDLSIMPVKHE